MSTKGSYNFSQYFPCKENLHNFVGSLPPVSIVSHFITKLSSKKKQNVHEDVNSERSHSLSFTFMLEKFSHYTGAAHSFIFDDSKPQKDICPCGASARQTNIPVLRKCGHLDPSDFYHAVKNSHENVPNCCVEPYILNGYVLPHRPWRYYLKVLWIPNNEALNVWTHLLPCLYFIWMLCSFHQTINLLHAWPLLFVSLSAIALTFFSSMAHMFHSRSSYHHCCLFILDYFGITMFAFSSTAAHFFVSAEVSFYTRVGWYNIFVFMLIACIGFYFCSFSQTGRRNSNTYHRSFKLWANGIGYFYGMVPLAHRVVTSNKSDPALSFHLLQFVFMLVSPAWYASDMPQKWWPGKFDIIGHSHQIFHIFVALGCYFDIRAIHLDVTTGRWAQLYNQMDYPPLATACSTVLVLVAYCVLVGFYFSRKLKRCFQDEINHFLLCQCKHATFYVGETNNNNDDNLKKIN